MATTGLAEIGRHFETLEDPRVERTKLHDLMSIIVIAICGVICGADNWVAMEAFGQAKLRWLKQFLPLDNGIPSHDTFGRVFSLLDAQTFERCFMSWVQAVSEVTAGEVVAVDGKTLRRSHDRASGKGPLHLISAWATENGVVLGQRKVESHSNEIPAIPRLLEVLALEGCIVTVDAMGCQEEIAQAIVAQEADYVLAVKANQSQLLREITETFSMAQEDDFRGIAHDHYVSVGKGHGRIETRRHWTIYEPSYIDYLNERGRWPNLRSIGMVEATRRVGTAVERETRYYISSLPGDAEVFGRAVRSHWGIENQLHWVLDVAFREDDCRVRQGHAAQNLATLRRLALTLLRRESTASCGIATKRLKAAWDTKYLIRVLCA